jgi:para-nitrobenzyl esterase
MQDAWLAFARSGDPNAPGVPQWPRYDIHRRATMEFGKVTGLVNDPAGAQRRAWDGLPFDDHSPDPGRYMQLMLSNDTDRDW